MKFGQLDGSSFTSTSMQPLADLVAASEDVSLFRSSKSFS